jgi:hypothetical protein
MDDGAIVDVVWEKVPVVFFSLRHSSRHIHSSSFRVLPMELTICIV